MRDGKKPHSDTDNFEKELTAFYEKIDKDREKAAMANPQLASFLDEVKQQKKIASCRQLMLMVEKARMFRDNFEWKTDAGWSLANFIHGLLLEELHKRCPELWKKYASKWLPKIVRQMEEALEIHKTRLNVKG